MSTNLPLPPDAILFDLDNTLCDYIHAKYAACKAVVKYLGCGEYLELFEFFRRPLYSFEDTRHIHDYMQEKGIYDPSTALEAEILFDKVKIDQIAPYPGVHETLRRLAERGLKMAIVTDAYIEQARERLKKCGVEEFFPVVITPNDKRKPKPNHTPFHDAIRELQADGPVWLVGDSVRREIIPGNELGFVTVYARYGDFFLGKNPDIQPTYTIDCFADLLTLQGLTP